MKTSLTFFYRIGFFTLAGVFVLGQFGRFELPGARAVYFQDILLAFYVAVFCLQYRKKVSNDFFYTKLGRLFLFANTWIVFTSLLNFHENVSQLLTVVLYLVRFDIIVFFGYILKSLVEKKVFVQREILDWILTVVCGIAIGGFIQYRLFPDTRGLYLLGWDDHYYRLISTIFDPGFTGIILVIGSLFALQQLSKSFLQENFRTCIVFLLSTVALLLTYSRASYLAFGVGIIYLAWRLKKYVLFLFLPLFALAVILLPRPGGEGVKLERTASIVSRIDSVDSSFTGFGLKSVLIGKGWYWKKETHPTSMVNGALVPNHSSAAENSYVFVLTSLGIIGLGIGLYALYLLAQASQWSSEVIASCIAVGVHALFTNTWFYPFVLILLAVIMARNGRRDLESSR